MSQLAWLEADLKAANANRANVPWILLTSHYPLYCSTCANIAAANVSAASWVGPEFGGVRQHTVLLLPAYLARG